MPDLAAWQWALGALCALLVGVAKTGVPGLGVLVVPLMVYVVSSGMSAPGALLPLLIAADLFAVVWYRRHARWDKILRLVPWIALGMGAGALVLWRWGGDDAKALNPLIGAIVIAMVAMRLFGPGGLARGGSPAHAPSAFATPWFGATAGFTTTVSNAAGPVMNLYLLGQKLEKEAFIGTGAWLFCLINWSKVPIFASQGMITRPVLVLDACLVGGVIVGALCGRWLFSRVPQKTFEWMVLLLAAAAAVPLLIPR